MGEVSVTTSIHAVHRSREVESRDRPIWPGILLFTLLVFGTSTVFVRAEWPLQAFQIGIYALVAVQVVLEMLEKPAPLAKGWTPWLVYLIPLWGVLQIVAHTTVSTLETREAALRWGSLAGVFFLVQVACSSKSARRIMLHAFLVFGALMAVLCLTQLFTSEGRVLWLFPTGYPDVYATFPYYNNYAQFSELALPIALWEAFRKGWKSWGYGLAAGLIYASVIGSASRAGTAICTAEILGMIAWNMARGGKKRGEPGWHSTLGIFVMVAILASAFTLIVGVDRVWARFKYNDPFVVRREFVVSAVEMAKNRPLTGFGLGTFPEVYQRFAIRDFPFYANHTHNDWAEFAADGGIPFLLLVLIPFAAAVPTAFRHQWGLGLVAVMVHACVDYPFPRPAVSGWMFAMLALLCMARMSDRRSFKATVESRSR